MKYIKKFENHDSYELFITSEDYRIPNISYCVTENEVHYNDYSKQYLTFVARENGTISFNIWKSMGTDMIASISYSTDNGKTWTTTNNTDNKEEHLVITVNVSEGDKIMWKGDAQQTGYNDEDDYVDYVGSFFSSDCEFDVKGNVMSLLYGDDFKGEVTLEYDGQFTMLFYDYDGENECKVVNAKNLSLPATTLVDGCYQGMFQGCTSLTTAPSVLPATTLATYCYSNMFEACTSLTTAPQLPATTLAGSCYEHMFYGCTSLTTAPSLPATTLAIYCYNNMFYNCTSLTTAPELPATTLVDSCYYGMFEGCTSLITAPELPATTLVSQCYHNMFQGCISLTTAPSLPATTLATYCYSHMFYGCTSLTTAPELPATRLVSGCYQYMFRGCTRLNYIKAMFTTEPSTTYTSDWVNGVASSGTFVKNKAASWDVSGANGVPSGWEVQTAAA